MRRLCTYLTCAQKLLFSLQHLTYFSCCLCHVHSTLWHSARAVILYVVLSLAIWVVSCRVMQCTVITDIIHPFLLPTWRRPCLYPWRSRPICGYLSFCVRETCPKYVMSKTFNFCFSSSFKAQFAAQRYEIPSTWPSQLKSKLILHK